MRAMRHEGYLINPDSVIRAMRREGYLNNPDSVKRLNTP
jgi:hypothetical protein